MDIITASMKLDEMELVRRLFRYLVLMSKLMVIGVMMVRMFGINILSTDVFVYMVTYVM